MSRLGFPRFLGRGSFPPIACSQAHNGNFLLCKNQMKSEAVHFSSHPGRATPDYRSSALATPTPRFVYLCLVCRFRYLLLDTSINHGAHPFSHWTLIAEMPEAKNTCLPQLRVITHGAIPSYRSCTPFAF